MKSISVIIPCYNHAATVGRCLESVYAQTLPAFEVVVVDDGSTDALDAALKPFLGKIKLVRQINSGGPAARNRGFRESKGDLVLFCDADIILRPDALEKLTAALDAHPEAAYAYASFKFGWKAFPLGPFDPARLKKHNYIHTGSLIRREKFPGFDESLKRFQDWDLWLTMLERGDTGVWVPEFLANVHVSSKRGGISNWLPKLAYRLPWKWLGWKPKRVVEYEAAAAVIRRKHSLA
ncbi:MAG: glycosyltransferase family A protein [Patescibacteria group bacterium]|nr:MAG: glycosyltransferase family A protein [Patescibacteria group bacterium]